MRSRWHLHWPQVTHTTGSVYVYQDCRCGARRTRRRYAQGYQATASGYPAPGEGWVR